MQTRLRKLFADYIVSKDINKKSIVEALMKVQALDPIAANE